MRRTSEAGSRFPWSDPTVCFIEQFIYTGHVVSVGISDFDRKKATQRAQREESRLFAVWPGKTRSDLFEVDDLTPLMRIHGVDEPVPEPEDDPEPEPEPEPEFKPVVVVRCALPEHDGLAKSCNFHQGHEGPHSWEG